VPELPEVETVARQLAGLVRERTVVGLRVLDPSLKRDGFPRVAGRRVSDVTRSGKRVLFSFSPSPGRTDELWLAVHLRMTGRLIWFDEAQRFDTAHLRARFRLDRGSLLFYDTRRFGTFQFFRSFEDTEPEGVDPLSPGLNSRSLGRLIGSSKQNIKAWLLRQDRLVGLGNIYASEILFVAGISPLREAASLSDAEHRRLLRATRHVLRRAIGNCGTTFSDFQDAQGVTGSYQNFLAVYGRGSEPCPRCRTTVIRLVQQQRSTFYCPHCQE
jgi:formamidopyrimidine-DNA glycosylase